MPELGAFDMGVTGWASGEWRAMLRCTNPVAAGMVIFDFNPEQIQIDRSAETRSYGSASPHWGSPGGSSGSVFRKSSAGSIKLSNVVFNGKDIKARIDQLFNWMSPAGGVGGQVMGVGASALRGAIKTRSTALDRILPSGAFADLATKIPVLTFNWGPPAVAFWYDVQLQTVNATYTRFSELGIPYQAKLTLHMLIQPSLLGTLPTNPTSGGLPGRGRHVVTEGENLQGIATETYGGPGRWRALAEANGIDDPLRMRPGKVVYLPNRDEMAKGA